LTIYGVHNYQPHDLGTALEFLRAHHNRYPFAELVSERFSLNDAENAFRFANERQPIRVAVVP
jgi:hypothetical protein